MSPAGRDGLSQPKHVQKRGVKREFFGWAEKTAENDLR
jgi:hypothetical protein